LQGSEQKSNAIEHLSRHHILPLLTQVGMWPCVFAK
jgi:hypothetical protein